MSKSGSAASSAIALCLSILAAATFTTVAADTWPNCSFKCTAGDVTLTSLYISVPGGACEPGGTSTAQVYGRFTASAKRYAIILIGALHVEGGATRHLTECAGDLSAGTTDVLLTTITWPCGSSVTLGNVVVSWSASPETCASATCSSRTAKCSKGEDLDVSTPLVVDFASDSPQCLGTPISFTNASAGGTAPLAYSWTFGDGGTSTQASPSHIYGAAGTYTVTLTVRDRTGATDSHSRSITVSPIPAATAANSGPYCPGATVSLVSSGGTSYSWTGPSGFTSSLQNPTISSVSAAKSGTYTVTVWNSAGCVAQASTVVVVDSTSPTLTAPADATVACSHPTGPAATGQATATDDSGHAPAISYADVESLGSCGGTGTITRTWTATDACGNSTSALQTITVADTTAPVLLAPGDAAIECGHSVLPAATGQATATDACSSPTVSHSDQAALTDCGTGTIARTWVATDSCGSSATAVQTLVILDSLAPHLSLPADITVECGQSTEPAATGRATATDACSEAVVTYDDEVLPSGCSGSGTIRRTWTAADACGHVVSGVQTITLVDSTLPQLTVPVDAIVECGHSTEPSSTGHAVATDLCSTPVVAYIDDAQLTGCGGTGTLYRTWTATDACGRTETGVQTITVVDTQPPALTVPGDVTVDVGHSTLPPATGQAVAVDACSPATVTYLDAPHLSSEGIGTITRTWTATDLCGQSAAGTQTITVVSAPPPPTLTLTLPEDTTVEAGHPTDPAATGVAIASSTCPSLTTLAFSDAAELTGCDGTGRLFRTWTASDACGNTASGVQVITVVDTGGIVLTVPADAIVEAGTPSDPGTTGWAAASDPDAVDEPPTVVFSDVADLSGCDGTGTILRTWTATDECGNAVSAVQTITVVDSGHITLAVPATVTVQAGDPTTPDATGWATASDPDAVDEPPSVTYADTADLSGCDGTGSILRTWTATDECGNSSSAVQTILVVDTVPPLLTVPADVVIETIDSTGPSATGWATVGHHDPEHAPTLTYVDVADLTGCDGTGIILRTWMAVDGCGNSASAVQVITVVDSGHVSLLVPPPAAVACGDPYSPDATGWATASDPDAVYEAPEVTYSDAFEPLGCGGTGIVTRTWTAADECGNAVSAAQTITLVDVLPPVLGVPGDLVVEFGTSTEPAATGRASAADTCSTVALSHSDEMTPGACAVRATILRTWTASDECGNRASATQTLTIVDTTAPALLLPPDAMVECGHSTLPAATGTATASDAGGILSVTYADRESAGGCDGARTILRTWTAIDACGNASSAVQAIQAIDSTPPDLAAPADVVLEVGRSTLPIDVGQASATDACLAPIVTYSDAPALAGDGTGIILRTWTAADACGNATQAVQTITLTGAPPPQLTLTVPSDRVVEAGSPTEPSATGTAVATGNCPGGAVVGYTDENSLGGCDGTGVIVRTWTAVDACGGQASAVQTIAVVDTGRVELVVPGDVTVDCHDSIDPSVTGVASAYDPDANGEPPVVSYFDAATLDSCSGTGTILRTWTATDSCGNSVSAIQTITVAGSCAPRVIISEIAWAGTGAGAEEQWIELRNLGDEEIDLAGWTLRWRAAKPEVPGDEIWKTLELCGAIAPAAREAALLFGPNPEDPQTWWVDLSGRQARRDFFLLERASDATVLDVPAGLVYDDRPEGERTLGLSNRGDVLELISPSGCVVDTANAARDGLGGWAAGDPTTRGSMERTDPYGQDVAENWHTNLGIITSGTDAGGVGLLATAGLENEPRLAKMVAVAAENAMPIGGGASLTIPLPGQAALTGEEAARVVVLAPGTDTPVSLPLGITTSGDVITITASSPLPSGQHAVWVRIGEVALLVLVQGP